MSGTPDEIVVIAIDPGTHKCGVAVLTGAGEVTFKDIISRDDVVGKVKAWHDRYPGSVVVVGAATQGKAVMNELSERVGIEADIVDESNTTDEARELFWAENRPGCTWGIFPPSFRPIPRPIDDYAAIVIGRRFLKKN